MFLSPADERAPFAKCHEAVGDATGPSRLSSTSFG
jgi:hypothetical protein